MKIPTITTQAITTSVFFTVCWRVGQTILRHSLFSSRNLSLIHIFRQCFSKYLTTGGMPYLSNLRYDETASRQYLRDLFNSVELKDVVKRNNIRDVDMLERIIAYVTSNIGTTFSSTAISKYLKSEGRSVSPETVLGYIRACTEAFLSVSYTHLDVYKRQLLSRLPCRKFISSRSLR